MRTRTMAAWVVFALVAAATFSIVGPAGAQGVPDNPGSPADYWTAQRRAAAIPRDLVIDQHGQGYLRRPDGTLEPYGQGSSSPASPGNQLQATSSPVPAAKASGQAGGSNDTTPTVITNLDPNVDSTIADSYTFMADVTDDSGVRSVTFVIVYPNGSTTQSFSATAATGDPTYSLTIQGFSDDVWSWYVVAKDTAKGGGNTETSATVPFTVATGSGGGGGGDQVVTNASWTNGGAVQTAAGRLYFEMPTNWKKNRWSGYVCSATTVTDSATVDRSIILTAAHCIYDDANKAFARNALFIPDQASTSGSGTDLNCSNDTYGCWAPSFGVVDSDWATRTWPNNIPWDYGFYVVKNSGAHSGSSTTYDALEVLSSLPVSLTSAPTSGDLTAALGYSYSDDPNFMYCQEGLGADGSTGDWFLASCALSGGASGGPWLQPISGGGESIVSINSYGYSNQPGMGGPKLNDTSASCLFAAANTADLSSGGTTPTNC